VHILYFSRDYSTHDHRFLSALAQTEHRVSFLRLERRDYLLEERALPPGIEDIPWLGGNRPARIQDGPSLLLDLKRVIREIKPDLIQAGPIQRCAFLTALSGYRPLVSMSWGYDLLQDASRGPAWSWATRYTLRRSAALVADCETIRQLAVNFDMPADRIVAFPWGIDLEHFHPIEPSKNLRNKPPKAPFSLLSTRSWEPIYGVDVIAEAFVQAAAQRSELRLVMLGNGSQSGMLHRILSQVDSIQPEQEIAQDTTVDRVIFPGQIGFEDLPGYYQSADLYVAATHSDGTSISLLEAMACGCPVLVSDIPGNREWVTPGLNGWLFPDGDANALAQAILHALDSRHLLPEMGRAARKIAQARADWNKNFPQLLRAYQIALNVN
jgi:glycosyltransferase involved in cell wall biosynthesis